MFRAIVIASLATVFGASGATAQSCGAYPNTLTNGTNADANKVMANFNSILACANSLPPVASPQFTGTVGILGSTFLALTLERDTANNVTVEFKNPSGSWFAGQGSGGNFNIDTDGNIGSSPLFTVAKTTGNVGIGLSAPSLKLEVDGSAGGTAAWTVTSDARLKKDVERIPDALSLVGQLRGVRYRWRAESERAVGKELALPVDEPQIGFIAQEVARVVPEAVVAPGKDAPDGIYRIRETALLPLLVEAVKEQQAQIAALRTEIAALKASMPGVLPAKAEGRAASMSLSR